MIPTHHWINNNNNNVRNVCSGSGSGMFCNPPSAAAFQHPDLGLSQNYNNNINSTPAAHRNAEDLLAKEMKSLTMEERQKIFNDIYGTTETIEETEEFIAACLQKMENAIGRLPKSERKDLDQAFFLKPSLCDDDDFQLMFLRAEHYDARAAAKRMAMYFTTKRELFGDDLLVAKITMDDIDISEFQKAMETGLIPRLLPNPDRLGRPIWYAEFDGTMPEDLTKLFRCVWYHLMVLLEEDERAQRHGPVCVTYVSADKRLFLGLPITLTAQTINKLSMIWNVLPVRPNSFHLLNSQFSFPVFHLGLGRDQRLRITTHFGSPFELKYSLLKFGIQLGDDAMQFVQPGDGDNNNELEQGPQQQNTAASTSTTTAAVQQYMLNRRVMETKEQERIAAAEIKSGIIAFPSQQDVLLGRGRPYPDFSGNRRLVELVDRHVDSYRSCDHQFEKTVIVKKVMEEIYQSGGCFLRRKEDGWGIVTSEEVAIKKIASTFRSRPNNNKSRSNSRSSSTASAQKTQSSLKPTSQPALSEENDTYAVLSEKESKRMKRDESASMEE